MDEETWARRDRIAAALRERRADLASMYEMAHSLLDHGSNKGGERVRVSLICHAMREVMAKSVRALARSASPRVTPTSGEQVQRLPALLTAHPDMNLEGAAPQIVVPLPAARAFDRLIKTAVQETARNRGDVASLLTDDGNEAHPAVAAWIETSRYFVKWAHLHDDDLAPEVLPDDNELKARIATYEELMDGVLTEFFQLQRSIAALLKQINEGTGDLLDV